MTTLNIDDGYVALPRRVAIGAFFALAFAAIAPVGTMSWYVSKLDSRIETLEATDRRLADKDTAMTERIEQLDRDRDRLARVEEQVRIATDLLREIRQDLRRSPTR